MISRTMDMVATLISKPLDPLINWIERQANDVNPFAQELATQRIYDYKKLLQTGGGHCPYSGLWIPPTEGDGSTTAPTPTT